MEKNSQSHTKANGVKKGGQDGGGGYLTLSNPGGYMASVNYSKSFSLYL